MASLKPFDESRKITVFCEKTCQALFCPASTILSGRRQLPWPVLVEKWVSFLSSVFFDNYLLLFQ
jgi:hypothetical protein